MAVRRETFMENSLERLPSTDSDGPSAQDRLSERPSNHF
jgi:hypothetical protein